MKFRIHYFVAAVLAVAVFASGALVSEAMMKNQKDLVRAAKKEGAVTIINPLFSDRTAKRMGPAFAKHYGLGSGFKFRNLRKGTGATVSQVRQEMRANKFTVDVHVVSAPGFFAAAQKRGAYHKLDSAEWNKHFAAVIKKAGQYANYPYVVTPLAYTFQPVWNTACKGMKDLNVTSYADTISKKVMGQTIAGDITKSFTYTNTVISLIENGMDMNKYWDDLKATKPVVMFRTEPKMQVLINCERGLDPWNITGRVYQNVLKKPDLAKVLRTGYYKEGQVMLGNQAAVLNGAPNPNAGKLLVEFLLTKEGTDVYVEGEAVYSFRAGYKPPKVVAPYLLDLSKHKLLGLKDWVGAQKKFKATRAEFIKRFK